MRLKKDHVRREILEASKQEFFLNGYKDANMRSIAERAHITPGNIYRYYQSKEELFDAIVKYVYTGITNITRLENIIPKTIFINSKAMIDYFINYALDIVIKNKYECIILLARSSGSKYEGVGDIFTEFTAQSIDKTRKESNIELSRVIAKSVIHAEIDILEEYIEDESKIRSISLEFLNTIFASYSS